MPAVGGIEGGFGAGVEDVVKNVNETLPKRNSSAGSSRFGCHVKQVARTSLDENMRILFLDAGSHPIEPAHHH
ncbi:hypothetical protein ElyMa_002080500 [Elysia marginata]|uniref:Uncharacterized protein n=1 Tax=Elysia marginata TaxID=1093978 RepID=A0AAV4FBJ8_9GAST|nr:hypothetical protein ElyMa_002080500 [Elysia marginata]